VAVQRADFWQQQGAADAAVRLMLSGLLRSSVSYAEVCRAMGIPDGAALDAVARFRATARPRRRRFDAPGPAPAGTKWCGYGGHFVPYPGFAPNRTSSTGLQSWCRACNVHARRDERQRKAAKAAEQAEIERFRSA
jgi:hypothetical protein